MKLDLQPGSSSFPEGTSSPDGLHAANYKGNPGSVEDSAKNPLIAAMPGSHQMSGLFIRLGVPCPGCSLAGLDLPRGVMAPLPPLQKKGCFWCSSVPVPTSVCFSLTSLRRFQFVTAREEEKHLIRPQLLVLFRSLLPRPGIGLSSDHRNLGFTSQGSTGPCSACTYLQGKMVLSLKEFTT